MGRINTFGGEESKIYSYRGTEKLDKALRKIAKRRGTTHTRLTYDLLMEHPDIINELKPKKHEHSRTRKTDSI